MITERSRIASGSRIARTLDHSTHPLETRCKPEGGAAPVSVANLIGWASAHHGYKSHKVSASPTVTHITGCARRTIPTGQGRTPLVEITNVEDLEEWLRKRPREDAVLIAARIALRSLPLLAPVIHANEEEDRKTVLLPVMRGLLVASVAGFHHLDDLELARLASKVTSSSAALSALYETLDSIHSAIDALLSIPQLATKDELLVNVVETAIAFERALEAHTEGAGSAARSAMIADVLVLEKLGSHAGLASSPLWLSGRVPKSSSPSRFLYDPINIPEPSFRLWNWLRRDLRSANEDWFVWVDWYQDRLDGKAANEDLEVAKALIPDETWDAGPAVLNAEIARLIWEHAPELPETLEASQSKTGERFGGTHEQRIDLADDPLVREIRKDDIAQEFHAEVLDAAEQVLKICRRSNQLDRLAETVDVYLKRLGATPEEVQASMVGRGERLRTLRDADKRLQDEDDPIPGPMTPDAFALLEDLISAHNQYVATDPALKAIQDTLADPQAQTRAIVTPAQSETALEDIAPILTDAAVEALTSATQAAQVVSEAGNRARVWLAETWRNLSVEMFRRALYQLRQSVRAMADHVELSARLTVDEAMDATQAIAAVTWRNTNRGALGMGIIEVTPSVVEAMGSLTKGADLGGRFLRYAEGVAGHAQAPIGWAIGLVIVALLGRLLYKTNWFAELLDDEHVKKIIKHLKPGA